MRRALAVVALVVLALAAAGCPKKSGGNAAPDAAASAAPSGAPVGSPAPDAAASAAPSGAPVGEAAAYAGNYTLAPAPLHIPESKDYAHVKQAKDDPSKLVGPGTLSLTVGADGRVHGEIDSGPASPSEIDGSLVDGEIRGVVRRKTPSDNGLTGTIVAKLSAGQGEGKLSLAEGNAALLREGAVTFKRK